MAAVGCLHELQIIIIRLLDHCVQINTNTE